MDYQPLRRSWAKPTLETLLVVLTRVRCLEGVRQSDASTRRTNDGGAPSACRRDYKGKGCDSRPDGLTGVLLIFLLCDEDLLASVCLPSLGEMKKAFSIRDATLHEEGECWSCSCDSHSDTLVTIPCSFHTSIRTTKKRPFYKRQRMIAFSLSLVFRGVVWVWNLITTTCQFAAIYPLTAQILRAYQVVLATSRPAIVFSLASP